MHNVLVNNSQALPGRFNVVLENRKAAKLKEKILALGLQNTVVCESLEEALRMRKAVNGEKIDEFFVCGGKMLYEYAIKKKECASIF